MQLVPFEPEHALRIEAQSAQRPYVKWMTPDIVAAAAEHFSFSGFDAKGRLIGCAGLAPFDWGLVAWAIFSELIEGHALAVTRSVKNGLDLHSTVPVFALIFPEHAKAAVFAERLSFRFKEVRAGLHPSGADLHLFVREGR